MLNGASSSGKTTLLKALQAAFTEPYLDAGIDKFIWMLPGRYLNPPLWQEVFHYQCDVSGRIIAIYAAERGHQLMSGMHHSIADLARTGNHVLADHVLLESVWVRECAALFADLPVWLIGVRCPLDVLIEREQLRKDRTLGQAEVQFHAVHAHTVYDLEVDTSQSSVDDCVSRILRHVYGDNPPVAFKQLRELH